jgi:hypothetical protein
MKIRFASVPEIVFNFYFKHSTIDKVWKVDYAKQFISS